MANFSPVSLPEILSRPPEQIFLKRHLRLPAWRDFQRGLNFSAVVKLGL